MAKEHLLKNGETMDEALSDEKLLDLYAGGVSEAFEALMKRYERELKAYLRRYIHNEAAADDVFQSTFLQVHIKHQQFDSSRKFRSWLYAIAMHQAVDWQRRNRKHRRTLSIDMPHVLSDDETPGLADLLVSPERTADVRMEVEQERERMRNLVARLSPDLQKVVQGVYFDGLKYREVAKEVGIPMGTVKSRLHMALTKLAFMYPRNEWKRVTSP